MKRAPAVSAVIVLVVIALTESIGFLAVEMEFVKASPEAIAVPDDYTTIQAAIANASPGDTIFVRSGSYTGGIVIDKPISLRGESANTTTIVGGATAGDLGVTSLALRKPPETSFYARSSRIQSANFLPPLTFAVIINSNDVAISGFTIKGGDRAIYSSNGNRLQIQQNILGTCILGGSNNSIISNEKIGLTISGYHNLIENNSGGLVASASNSTIKENALTAFALQNAHNNTIANNTLTGSNMGLWIGSSISGGPPACTYNLFAGNRIENCGLWGILMGAGSYNIFYGNIVKNTGADLDHDGYGLALGGNGIVAENNLFLHNIFVNNSKNFATNWQVTGTNFFDDGKEGNYWDDYLTKYPNASEVNQSGTGDTPYVLTENNVDNHPLLVQPEVTENVPVLPELWAFILSAPSVSPSPSVLPSPSQTPLPSQSPTTTLSPSPSIPEFPTWMAVPIFFASAFLVICWKRGNRR